MGSSQMYNLSWAEYGTSLASTVQVLRSHGELVDVTLAAGGRIFPAHKLVLSAASPLLMELLKSTGCQHPVVMLAGVTAYDLEALLQFLYHGEVSVDPTQLPSLLQAAHCLDIQALSPNTVASEKIMCQSMDVVPSDDVLARAPVRKRKRRQGRPSEGSLAGKWPHMDLPASLTNSRIDETSASSNTVKEEPTVGVDETLEGAVRMGTRRLVSDQPVECTICGVVLKQSRNLRRHMALIHLMSNGKTRRSKKEMENSNSNSNGSNNKSNRKESHVVDGSNETDTSGSSTMLNSGTAGPPPAINSVGLLRGLLYHESTHLGAAPPVVMCDVSDSQTQGTRTPPPTNALTDRHTLPLGDASHPTDSLHLMSVPPPPLPDTSQLSNNTITTFVPTTMHHDTLQFAHDSLFRHQNELMRTSGLYNATDTREQCVNE